MESANKLGASLPTIHLGLRLARVVGFVMETIRMRPFVNLRVAFLVSCGWHRVYVWQVNTALQHELLCKAVQILRNYNHRVIFVVHELRLLKVSVLGYVQQLLSCCCVLVGRCA